MSQHILIVDDEVSIVTLLKYNLEQEGFYVSTAMDGKIAFEKAINSSYDLIILDIMLPEMDGIEICKQLRQNKVMTPIMMLTAKDDVFDKVLSLELGADGYLTKPFSPREVISRIKAILRRTIIKETLPENNRLIIGELEIYPDNFEIYIKGKSIDLTQKEFELLVYMAHHRDKALSREQLLQAVWNYDFVGDTRVLDVQVSHLRDKIQPNPNGEKYIKTIRGIGYKLETPNKVNSTTPVTI